MSHVGSLGSSGSSISSGPSGLSRRADSAAPSGSTDRLSAGSDLGRSGARWGSIVLRGLSDRELLSRVKDLVSRERAVALEVLVHLIEVERRRLHVGIGYASMFDYCSRHLGYSSSSSARRIHTARCLRDYPEVLPLLEKNDVNLSTVSLVSSILSRENYKDVLERIRGKSQKEVEGIVADYRPPVSMRDRARPVWVAVPVSGPAASEAGTAGARSSAAFGGSQTGSSASLFSTASCGERGPEAPKLASAAPGMDSADPSGAASTQGTLKCDHSRCGSEKTPNSAGGAVRLEKKQFVQFVASERFMKKLEKAKALLSNGRGDLSFEAVLEAALDEFLKDHDPDERNKRREERKQRAESKAESVERGATDEGPSRRIPAAVRDAVYARDKGRCTYSGSDGKRCAATYHLQIDHVIPYARGGTHALGNLRLLCERHNKLEAERVLGANALRRVRRRQ